MNQTDKPNFAERMIAAAAVIGILGLTACGTVTAKTDPVKSPGTGAAKAAKAGIGDTQTIGGLEITVKSVDRSLVVEWTEGSQLQGSPFFGVAVRWKNVGTNVIEDPPVWGASTADGTMNDGVAAEPNIGKKRGNLQVGMNSANYHLLPGTAREGWLTFEQKPGPLTKLYITVGGDTATWALTK